MQARSAPSQGMWRAAAPAAASTDAAAPTDNGTQSDSGAQSDSARARVAHAASVWSGVGFGLAVLPPFWLFGLAACVVGIVLSRRAGRINRLAVAGVILALALTASAVALLVALGSSGFALFGTSVGSTVWVCTELGQGEHVVDGLRYTCR